MHVQLVHIQVKPGKAEDFLEAFRVNYEGTRNEPGNVRFDVLRDPADENRFVIYEVFRTPGDLDSHRQTEHYKECVRRIDPLLDGERTKDILMPVMADYSA